jgi:hypothetical protein
MMHGDRMLGTSGDVSIQFSIAPDDDRHNHDNDADRGTGRSEEPLQKF